jgi:hypothetical protein
MLFWLFQQALSIVDPLKLLHYSLLKWNILLLKSTMADPKLKIWLCLVLAVTV